MQINDGSLNLTLQFGMFTMKSVPVSFTASIFT